MVALHLISMSIALLFSPGPSSSLGSAHCIEMVHVATFFTHHAISWTSPWCVSGSTIFACACSHHLGINLHCPSSLYHICFFLFCQHQDMFAGNNVCIAFVFDFIYYFCSQAFIIKATYKLFFYPPVLLYIFTFFCLHSYSFHPLLYIFIFPFFLNYKTRGTWLFDYLLSLPVLSLAPLHLSL